MDLDSATSHDTGMGPATEGWTQRGIDYVHSAMGYVLALRLRPDWLPTRQPHAKRTSKCAISDPPDPSVDAQCNRPQRRGSDVEVRMQRDGEARAKKNMGAGKGWSVQGQQFTYSTLPHLSQPHSSKHVLKLLNLAGGSSSGQHTPHHHQLHTWPSPHSHARPTCSRLPSMSGATVVRYTLSTPHLAFPTLPCSTYLRPLLQRAGGNGRAVQHDRQDDVRHRVGLAGQEAAGVDECGEVGGGTDVREGQNERCAQPPSPRAVHLSRDPTLSPQTRTRPSRPATHFHTSSLFPRAQQLLTPVQHAVQLVLVLLNGDSVAGAHAHRLHGLRVDGWRLVGSDWRGGCVDGLVMHGCFTATVPPVRMRIPSMDCEWVGGGVRKCVWERYVDGLDGLNSHPHTLRPHTPHLELAGIHVGQLRLALLLRALPFPLRKLCFVRVDVFDEGRDACR
eukprot:364468-Chlamydomonas_euryale.AAC.2